MMELPIELLTKDSFSPFGTVIELDGAESFLINEGTTRRFHALSKLDVHDEGGRAILSVFRAKARHFPIDIKMVEKHPFGSQAFVPLNQSKAWLVVVASGDIPTPDTCRAFIARGNQGVQYNKGCWHHPLLSLTAEADFLVADREGPGGNLEEVFFEKRSRSITMDDYVKATRILL